MTCKCFDEPRNARECPKCASIREARSRILCNQVVPKREPKLFGIEFNTMDEQELRAALYFLQARCADLSERLGIPEYVGL